MKCCVSIFAWLLACVPVTLAQSHYVSHWGSHSTPFTSWETAATNLAAAIEAAPEGAVIHVANGIYRTGSVMAGDLNTRARVIKPLTVQSTGGYRKTVIEGASHAEGTPLGTNAVRTMYMTDGILDGFTLRRGATDASGSEPAISGGGLYASGGSLSNIRVTGNTGYTAGGAWLETCTVSNGIFVANTSQTGPRIKINRRVFLEQCSIENAGMHHPDIRILGTNANIIINGEYATTRQAGTDFGPIHAITSTATHVFTITNQGSRTLEVEDISWQGGHTNDWEILDWPASGIAPGSSAPLEIRFDPQAPGPRRSLLFVANNDPDDDPYGIWLSGEGTQAEMLVLAWADNSVITNGSVSPSSEQGTDFGDVRLTGEPGLHSYIVTNIGNATLNITSLAPYELDTSDFTVTNPPAFPLAVAPGATAIVSVAFAPQALDYRGTLLRFESDAINSPYLFAMIGRGVEPEMRILGTNSDWIVNGATTPETENGTDFELYFDTPVKHTFTITNAGTHALTLTGTPHVVIAGNHPADFTVTQQPGSHIGINQTMTFDVEFMPTVASVRTAEVFVFSDDVYHTNHLYRFNIRGECSPTNRFIDIQAGIQPAGSSAMAWGDFNNDGWLDLAVMGFDGTNRFTKLYANLGEGTFSNINAALPSLDSGHLAWGDFNNNGWLDLAVTGMSDLGPVTAVFRNEGNGTFSKITTVFTPVYAGTVAWGDINNDGKLDLFVAGNTLSGKNSRIYRNQGNGSFIALSQNLTAVGNGRALWMDADADGWMDLLVSGESASGRTLRMYKNQNGTLTYQALSALEAIAHGGLAVADFNNDGMTDLAATGFSDNGIISAIYRYSGGSAQYTRHSTALTPLWLGDCAWGDLNNNGWTDLVISGTDSGNRRKTLIYENTNSVFSATPANIPGVRVSSIALGDHDNDGDLDIAVSGLAVAGNFSGIFRNLSASSNQPPSAPSGLTATLTNGNEIILSWEAATDAETPSAGLTYNLYLGTAGNPAAVMSPHADIATGWRRIPEPGNTRHRRQWHLRNLPPGQQLIWGVQAIDGAYAGGPFTNGTPVDVPEMPDFVISDIQILDVPFTASVVVSNQGSAAGNAGLLSVWLNRPTTVSAGTTGDLTRAVGSINPSQSETVVFTGFARASVTTSKTFRAFINSAGVAVESNKDNNQNTRSFLHTRYPDFWFNAVALTNNVYLRWINPLEIGMQSARVMIRASTTTYPSSPTEGSEVYQGEAQVFEHTGLTQGQPYFYSIWLTNDESNWLAPPE